MSRRKEANSGGRSVEERSEKRRDVEKKRSEEWREKCRREKRDEKRCWKEEKRRVEGEVWRYLAGARMRECYSSPGDTSPHPILEPHQMDDVIKDVFLSNHHQ
jgi:hypothetical protein